MAPGPCGLVHPCGMMFPGTAWVPACQWLFYQGDSINGWAWQHPCSVYFPGIGAASMSTRASGRPPSAIETSPKQGLSSCCGERMGEDTMFFKLV